MIKNQLKILIAVICIIAALALVYLIVVKPVLDSNVPTQEPTTTVDLMDDEELGAVDRIMMRPQVEKKYIDRVDVHSEFGDYAVVMANESDSYIEGAELCPTNPEIMASFFVNVGYLLSMTKVTAEPETLDEYGLDPAVKDVAHFTVTQRDGTSYKVLIGDKIVTGAGYYARMDGKNSVYVLDATLGTSVLVDKMSLMEAYALVPLPSNEYHSVDNFRIFRLDETFDLKIHVINGEIPEGSEQLVNYQMMHPARYDLSLDNYDKILRTFTTLKGERVVAAEITEETLAEYGFTDKGAHQITFDFQNKKYRMLFSALTENNTYYVTAVDFNTIIEVPEASLPFLKWDLLQYVERPIFGWNINDIASIAVESEGKSDKFILEGTGQELVVTHGGAVVDTPRFRQFYKSILYIELKDYAVMPENPTKLATMTIMTDMGEELKYEFYFLDSLNCFMTINGTGEFKVLRGSVNRLITNTEKFLNGDNVIAEAAE